MRRIALLLSIAVCALATTGAHATTYFIRHDGGTNVQCTGTTNAAYPGSGSGIACAYNHPYQLVSYTGTWTHLTTGDTVRFTDSPANTVPYYMGEQNGGLGTDWGGSGGSGPLGGICPGPNPGYSAGSSCIMPPPPNGVSFIGQNAGSCHKSDHSGLQFPTILSGIAGAFTVIDVQGTSDVTLNCIEITQPDDCVFVPASSAPGACGNLSNFIFAGGLIFEYGSTAQGPIRLTMQDLSVVGTANSGILGSHVNASGSDVLNATDVYIIGNANAGWNGDGGGCGTGCESVGTMNLNYVTVDLNGCLALHPYTTTVGGNGFDYCYGQAHFGYGDGFVQVAAGNLTLNITNSHFELNTQDGADGLHLSDDTTTSPIVNISTSWAQGNGGQGFKIGSGSGAQSTAINNVNIVNCRLLVANTAANVAYLESTYNFPSNTASFTATASGTNLTVTGVTGTIRIGVGFTGTGVPDGSLIVSQTSGTAGGAGVYVTNQATTISGATGVANWIPLDFTDSCRASGAQWSFQLGSTISGVPSSLVLENNTTAGYGTTMWEIGPAGVTTPVADGAYVIFVNNLNVGYGDPGNAGQLASGWFWGSSNFGPSVQDLFNNAGSIITNNLWYSMRTGCPNSTTAPPETAPPAVCSDPLLVSESNLNTLDPNLTGSSPAIGAGTGSYCPDVDYNGNGQTVPCTIGAFVHGGTPTVATPTFSPVAGSYGPTQTVTVSTSTGGASLIYTNDGSTPTVTALTCTITHGTLYSGPLTVSSSQTLKAIGCLSGDNASSVGTAAYVINGAVANPTCSPAAGSYASTQSVTCSSSTGGSSTVCTIDGSTPNHSSPACTSISVAASLTLKALSFEVGWSDSSVVSNVYTITGAVATPTFSPVAGTYVGTQSVTISTSTGGASVVYTNDGTTPTVSSGCTITNGTLYTGAVTVATSLTLKALGCETAFTPSSVASAAYTITAPPTPTLNMRGTIDMRNINAH